MGQNMDKTIYDHIHRVAWQSQFSSRHTQKTSLFSLKVSEGLAVTMHTQALSTVETPDPAGSLSEIYVKTRQGRAGMGGWNSHWQNTNKKAVAPRLSEVEDRAPLAS